MKRFEVRRIFSEPASIPSAAVLDTPKEPQFRSRFDLQGLRASRDVHDVAPGLDLHVEPLVRVELDVFGAVPQSNFANIRVNGQLLVGTILDEEHQKLTGYLPVSLPKDVDVEVEYSDGVRNIFHVTHI